MKMSHPTISLASASKHFRFQLFSTTFPSEKDLNHHTHWSTAELCLYSQEFVFTFGWICVTLWLGLHAMHPHVCHKVSPSLRFCSCDRVCEIQKGHWTNCCPVLSYRVLCHMFNRYHPLQEKTKLEEDWTSIRALAARFCICAPMHVAACVRAKALSLHA